MVQREHVDVVEGTIPESAYTGSKTNISFIFQDTSMQPVVGSNSLVLSHLVFFFYTPVRVFIVPRGWHGTVGKVTGATLSILKCS